MRFKPRNKKRILENAAPEAVLLYKHYYDIGVMEGWNRERVDQCCCLLGESRQELAASCAIFWVDFSKWYKMSYFPPHVALLFYMREQEFLCATKVIQLDTDQK